ncbi:MAG: hypothetical protein JW775_00690 [Candidatus Aminicenantes bacterium]|nr:hypothetical protein [Candidatus Aminicenantes bacterium]
MRQERLKRWTTPRAGSRFSRSSAGRSRNIRRKLGRKLKEPRFWVVVFELDDVVPRRDSGKPNLYVAVTVDEPARRIEALAKGKGPKWLRGHLIRLRDDLTSGPFLLREEAAAERRAAVRCLQSEGFTVNRGANVWTVYVIELDAKGCKDPGQGFVYVGMTAKSPEERFEEHTKGRRNKRGPLYAPVVKKWGRRLRMDLAPDTKYFDLASAKAAEKRWCLKLQAEGFRAVGGH